MPAGLQAWDANGVLTFDDTTPVVKFLGTATIGEGHTGEAKSGSIYDHRFTAFAQHVPFWSRIDGGFSVEGYDPTWHFEGNSLIWEYPREITYIYVNGQAYPIGRPRVTIIYGIR